MVAGFCLFACVSWYFRVFSGNLVILVFLGFAGCLGLV